MSEKNNGNPSVWKKRDAKHRATERANRDAKKARREAHAELMAKKG